MNPLVKEAIGSIIRWVLTFVGAVFVSKGIWTQAQADTYITAAAIGGATMLVALGLSFWQKYSTRLKLTTALASPHPMSESQVVAAISNGNSAPVSTPTSDVPRINP